MAPTWNDERSNRFRALRAAEARGALTAEQREELAKLLAELDAQEELALSAAAARHGAELSARREELARAQHAEADLERVLEARRALLAEAQDYLARLRARRAALAEEVRDVLRRTGTES